MSPFAVVVQSASHGWLFETRWTAALQASLTLTISWSLPKFMSIESAMPSNHLIICRSLLLLSVFPSIRVFSNESAVFASGSQSIGALASVIPISIQGRVPLKLTGLISLLSEALKSLLQHQSESINYLALWFFLFVCFKLQLSHPYMTTGKTIRSDQSLSHVRLFATP